MGEIIQIKELPEGQVKLKILITKEELSNTKGNLKNIHLFSTENFFYKTEINNRGNKGVTKYFKVPLSLRLRKKQKTPMKYQKINTTSKEFYIYLVDKKLK